VYETSPVDMSRPRQCVPLACVKYIRSQSPPPAAPVIDELRQSSTVPAPVSSLHGSCIGDSVPQTSGTSTVSTASGRHGPSMTATTTNHVRQSVPSHAVSTAAALQQNSQSHAPGVSATATVGPASTQYPTTTNYVRQSIPPSHTVSASQNSQCDVSPTSAATVGLVSAVWTPRGAATSQPAPPQNAEDAVRQQIGSCVDQLDLLGIHHRLTTAFNEAFSQHMNAIISVMHEACKVLTSAVFEYSVEQLRLLRSEYCQLTGICVAYGEYQKNVRGHLCTTFPAVTCLQSSVQIMSDSVNSLKAVFRQMHQWLLPDAKLTVTERGFQLSSKLCQFVPAFLQELGNFKRSLLMIVPNAVSVQLTNSSAVTPSTVSSVPSHIESSAATAETVTGPPLSGTLSPTAAQLQVHENVELQGQNVEPIFEAPAPIVIEPNEQAALSLIAVKQEPAETDSRRHRTRAELVYIGGDDGDDCAVGDRATSAVDPSDRMSASQHYSSNQLVTAQSPGMTGNCADDAASSAPLCVNSGDVLNNINDCIDLDLRDGASDIKCGVLSSVMPTCGDTDVHSSAAATCSSSLCLGASTCPHESGSFVPSLVTVAGTNGRGSGWLSDFVGVNTDGATEPAVSGDRRLNVLPVTGDVVVNGAGDCTTGTMMTTDVCLADRLSAVTGDLNDTHREASDRINHRDTRSGNKSLIENGGHSATSNHPDVNNMCTISSVCSIELERFDFIDTTENTALDDIVSAVRAFDENANIAFVKDDLSSLHDSEPSHSVSSPVKTVQKKKKKRVLASRVARRKQKQPSRALSRCGSNTCASSSVSDDTENAKDVDETNSCEETLLPESDKETADSATATDGPLSSATERIQNKVVGREDTNVEATLPKSAADITRKPLDAAQCSESYVRVSKSSQPEAEKVTLETENNADSSSEPSDESSVSESTVGIDDIDNSCQKAADLKREKQASSERHLVGAVEGKCIRQPESERRDETDSPDDDSRLNSPAKKKRARVIYEDEDVENQVRPTPTEASLKGKSVPRKNGISVQASDSKKVKKFRSSNAENVSRKTSKKAVLVEKQPEKKMKKQALCKQNHCNKNAAVTVLDKCVTAKASRANTVAKHTAVRKHKLNKSKKLLKLGVKPKTVPVMKGSKAVKNVSVDSSTGNVTAKKEVRQRLHTSQTVAVGRKVKSSSQTDSSVKAAFSASTVHSQGNGDQPFQSARDKVNAIFKNSEFTCLHGNTSLVHSRRDKPAPSAGILSPSKLAENRSKNDRNMISPVKNTRVSQVDSKRDSIMSKSVVTSGCLTGTAVTTSTVPVRSPYKSVASRPGGGSSSVRTTSSVVTARPHTQVTTTASSAQSHTPVNAKSGQRNHVETSQRTASDSTMRFSSASSSPAVSSNSANCSRQNPVPSLLSLKLKPPCFTEVTTSVASSASHSVTQSQPLSSSSTGSLRDPRLAQRQHPVSSEQQPSTLNKYSKAESSAAGVNSAANVRGSMQWPRQQADGAGIPTKGSVDSVLKEDTGNEPASCVQTSTTGCWMWELGKQRAASSQSSSLSVNGKSSAQNHYESTDSRKVHGRPAAKEGLSGPSVGRLTVNIESHPGRTVTLSEKDYTVRAPAGIMSPTPEDDLQQCVGDSSIPGHHTSPAGNTKTSDAIESLPCAKDPRWRLIPLDCSGISCLHNSAAKPLSERPRSSSDPSDPRRLNATSLSVCSSSHKRDKSGVSGTAYQSADPERRPVVTCGDTDSVSDDIMSDTRQIESMKELEHLQSEPLLPADGSLDERIGLFSSDMGSFSIEKTVEDHIDKMMTSSWWNTDSDDAGDNMVHSGDFQQPQHPEGYDSDVDHFVVIDDDDDDEDDNSNDGLVIDLDSSNVEIKQELCCEQSVDITFPTTRPGRRVKHKIASDVECSVTAETRAKHNALSDKDMRSTAKTEEHYKPYSRQQREHRLSATNDLAVAGHHDDSVNHRNGPHERMKQSVSKERGKAALSGSRNEYHAETSRRNGRNDFVKLPEDGGRGTKREIFSADSLTRNAHKVSALKASASCNAARQNRESLLSKDRASFCGKSDKATHASASSDLTSTVAGYISCLDDLSEPELGRLGQLMESRVFGQKISQCNKYACPLGSLGESEKRKLIADRLADPAVLREFSFDLRLQAVLEDIDRVRASEARMKNDPRRPSVLSKCTSLIVRRDWFYTRMNHLQRYYKSKCLLTLPDDLRLGPERGKFLSVEGIPLILSDRTISLPHCTRLASLLTLIKSHGGNPAAGCRPRNVRQKLGWLHSERRKLLSEICCSSAAKVTESVRCLSEKLVLYRYVTFAVNRRPLYLNCYFDVVSPVLSCNRYG